MEENIIEYGEVTDDVCPNCGKCSDYHLSVDYNYKKIFFLTLFEKEHRYHLTCRSCGTYIDISPLKASGLIEHHFTGFESKRKAKILLKNVFVVLLTLAAVFGAVWLIINTGDGRFKNLVADKPIGYYEIYDREGRIWAGISKQGEASYDLLVKRETVEEEEYDDIDDDLYYEYYYYEQEGELKNIEDTAGALLDKFGVCIQYFYYDTEEEDIFYYLGVDDLNDIVYSADRALYPMTFYSDAEEKYIKIYARNESREVVMMFGASLESVKVFSLDDGRVQKYEYYDILSEKNTAGSFRDISVSTDIDEAVSALRESGIQPIYSEEYLYYKDTKVIESIFCRRREPNTLEEIKNSIDYNVEEKDGYYIVSPAADDFSNGEKVVAVALPQLVKEVCI